MYDFKSDAVGRGGGEEEFKATSSFHYYSCWAAYGQVKKEGSLEGGREGGRDRRGGREAGSGPGTSHARIHIKSSVQHTKGCPESIQPRHVKHGGSYGRRASPDSPRG